MQSPDFRQSAEHGVYLRTSAGQREAVMRAADLDAAQRRVLLLVNGYTPLPDLVGQHVPPEVVPGVVKHLLGAGLIQPVAHPDPG